MSTTQMLGIYEKTAPRLLHSFTFVTRADIVEGIAPKEQLLLQPGAHSVIAEQLHVPELAVEVERAVQQVEDSLKREAELEKEASDKERSRKDSDKTK